MVMLRTVQINIEIGIACKYYDNPDHDYQQQFIQKIHMKNNIDKTIFQR